MTRLVPNRFLFSFEFPLRYRANAPRLDGDVDKWSDEELLPRLGELDGARDFADVWACWNESGLFAACRITGKRAALRCDPAAWWKSDNLRLCTDMRDVRSLRRGTRYCQQFYFLPTGGGRNGKEPTGGMGIVQRARESAPSVDVSQLRVAACVNPDGYSLEAHVPTACLCGFDPVDHPRIGLYYMLEDRELGQQYLTVGDDLYWFVDPSTWPTAVLGR